MKLRSPWVGSAKGKMGDGVYYRRRGVQCARARAIDVANPQSEQQMVTRAAFATATKLAASLNADIVSHSFEQLQYGEKSRNYFIGMAVKLFRQRINEAIGGENFNYAPVVGKMATFGNIASGLRISQGSLPTRGGSVLNRADDFSDANYALVPFGETLASTSAMASAKVADFAKIFGVDRTGQVTLVFFDNIQETESAQVPLNCAVPHVYRFSLLASAADTDALFVAGQSSSLTLNPAVIDTERSSVAYGDLIFAQYSTNSYSVGLGTVEAPEGSSTPVVGMFEDTQGVGFACIVSKWEDGKWLRSTETIHGLDGIQESAVPFEEATSWNVWSAAMNSYAKSGASETNDRYLNKEKN